MCLAVPCRVVPCRTLLKQAVPYYAASCHLAGTLKLLIEDIISNLLREGKDQLTSGAPVIHLMLYRAALCCACAGTLKLLIEDIISNLRREGKDELTFGFAPLFNIQDGKVFKPYIHWVSLTALYLYHCANNVYAFKNLAYSKSRYEGTASAGVTSKHGCMNRWWQSAAMVIHTIGLACGCVL